jgi:hypothetical protein
MAIYLIVSAILRLCNSEFLADFLRFAVQLLNFGVLLSYPINFFIYCRMSRAFRDAFTKLLCPSFIGVRKQRLQSIATPLLTKPCGTMANNDQLELNNTNFETKTPNITIISPTSVILNLTTNDMYRSSCNSLSPRTSNDLNRSSCNSLSPRNSNDMKKTSIGSLEKPRVSFGDDVNQSINTKSTDL